MAIQSLTRASVANANRKYNNALAGNPLYSDMELISTQLITTTNSAVFSFTNIPQTYKHLQLRLVQRFNNTSGTNYRMSLYLNGYDGVSNCAYHSLEGDGSAVTSTSGSTTTNISAGYVAMNNVHATNIFSASIIDILDYTSTTKNKTIRQFGGVVGAAAGTSSKVQLSSGFKNTTNAITALELSTDNGAIYWMAGSRLSLYGVKA